jgi:predicted CopG family antitoxin
VSNATNIVGPSSKWEPTNKTISIRTSTWKRLQKYIHYGQTYDSVIKDLLDEKERIIDSDMQEEPKNLGEFKI